MTTNNRTVQNHQRDERLDRTRTYYEPRIESFSDGYEIHGWENRESQRLRYQVLADAVDLETKSLLDVGCGVGDLFEFLLEQGVSPREYTGLDLLPSMVERASRRFPASRYRHARFVAGDLTTEHPIRDERFDVVYCSGALNLRIGDHQRFARDFLGILADLADHELVFNMLHVDSPDRDDDYCYFDPREVVSWPEIAALSPRVITGYLPNDFTVVCRIPPEV